MPNCGIHAWLLDELEVGARRVEAPPQVQRGRERRPARPPSASDAHQRLALGTVAAPAREQHQQRAGERQKDDSDSMGQEPCVDGSAIKRSGHGSSGSRHRYQPRISTTPRNSEAA